MITETSWLATAEIERQLTEKDLMVMRPYKGSITIMVKHGPWLAQAYHDGADVLDDIETLKMLCLLRYNKGESNEESN